jgi:hypothetical protein
MHNEDLLEVDSIIDVCPLGLITHSSIGKSKSCKSFELQADAARVYPCILHTWRLEGSLVWANIIYLRT